MNDRKIENARISAASLGYEYHGIFTSYLMLDYLGSGQAFGGFVLGDEITHLWITHILKIVGVKEWSDLIGNFVQVDHDWDRVYQIRNILGGDWFNPEEEFKKHRIQGVATEKISDFSGSSSSGMTAQDFPFSVGDKRSPSHGGDRP